MKLTDRTLDILKSFSSISPSIMLTPGKVLKTISGGESVVAFAEIDEEFDGKYAIYMLPQFINVFSLFEDYSMTFKEENVTIKGVGPSVGKKLRYSFSNAALIDIPPENGVEFPDADAECNLTFQNLKTFMKAIGILSLTKLALVGDGNSISLSTQGPVDDDNSYSIELGKTDKVFSLVFRVEDFNFYPGDYAVQISKEGIIQLSTTNDDKALTYWVVAEEGSVFE